MILTQLLASPAVPYAGRFGAALAGFVAASAPLYVAVSILAGRARRRLRAEERFPAGAGGVRRAIPLRLTNRCS